MTTFTPDELARLARGDCINKAKRLLREQLAIHRDEGVHAPTASQETDMPASYSPNPGSGTASPSLTSDCPQSCTAFSRSELSTSRS